MLDALLFGRRRRITARQAQLNTTAFFHAAVFPRSENRTEVQPLRCLGLLLCHSQESSSALNVEAVRQVTQKQSELIAWR